MKNARLLFALFMMLITAMANARPAQTSDVF